MLLYFRHFGTGQQPNVYSTKIQAYLEKEMAKNSTFISNYLDETIWVKCGTQRIFVEIPRLSGSRHFNWHKIRADFYPISPQEEKEFEVGDRSNPHVYVTVVTDNEEIIANAIARRKGTPFYITSSGAPKPDNRPDNSDNIHVKLGPHGDRHSGLKTEEQGAKRFNNKAEEKTAFGRNLNSGHRVRRRNDVFVRVHDGIIFGFIGAVRQDARKWMDGRVEESDWSGPLWV